MLLSLLYFPLAEEYATCRRRVRFYRLQNFILTWQEANATLVTMKANCSSDYTLGYVDVLWFANEGAGLATGRSSAQNEDIGPPQLPLLLRIAGDGSYHRPFFLDTNDPMVGTLDLNCLLGGEGGGVRNVNMFY